MRLAISWNTLGMRSFTFGGEIDSCVRFINIVAWIYCHQIRQFFYQRSTEMKSGILSQTGPPGVDRSLIKMFLRMTPEERLVSNDNMIQTLMELRNTYRQKTDDIRPERTAERD